MSEIIRRILKGLAYSCAGIVVLLAILLGLFRLFLPRLPDYQDQLKERASAAIGMRVEFAGMDARWGLRGPELSFYDAELIRPASGARIIAAGEVGIIVSLPALLFEQQFVVDTVRVRNSNVDLRERPDGSWLVQGENLHDLFPGEHRVDSLSVIGEDIGLDLQRHRDPQSMHIEVPSVQLQRDLQHTAIDLEARLPAGIGTTLAVSATELAETAAGIRPWNVTVRGEALQLAGLSNWYRDPQRRVSAGRGDVDLGFSLDGGVLSNVSATVNLTGVVLNDGLPFDLSGRVAYHRQPEGWLLAADELRFRSRRGDWPLSSVRIEGAPGADGGLATLDLRAAYLDFADAAAVSAWLPPSARAQLERWQPDGIVRNLVMSIDDLPAERPAYKLSADLERAGIAAVDGRPGVRGFSGSVRADPAGGLLAVDAYDTTVDLARWVSEPVEFDRVHGTVVWRRSGLRTTVLSDNITLTNALVDTRSNIEISIDGDSAPLVDLASNFRITDIAVAKRFIPRRLLSPKLYDWFQAALIAGRVPEGSAHLHGALDEFPFDAGGGRLLIEGKVTDLEFKYHPLYPVVSVASMDVVLDNTRLYTRRNRSVTLGNTTANARVEIPDLRNPVLRVDAKSRGTLDSLHAFASQSPLDQLLGGQLHRVAVSGPATLELDLDLPIRDLPAFTVAARIASDNGSLRIDGLSAPFTALSGAVTIERNHIESEALAGRFLGAPVQVELLDAGPAEPAYRVIGRVRGTATSAALVDELRLPLDGLMDGAADFAAEVRFPRGDHSPRAPLSIRVESDLAGLALKLPEPFDKAADHSEAFAGQVEFAPGATRIETDGTVGKWLAWDLLFSPLADGWEFDRGILMLGGAPPVTPDVRGLHIRGTVPELDIDAWLAARRAGPGGGVGGGALIRSVDLQVGTLRVVGQRLPNHRFQVDRSARDWLVQLDGEEVSGSVFVPYDFSPSGKLVLDMERLILPGAGEDDPAAKDPAAALDPRTLPAISVRAAEFGIGTRRFGSVAADLVHDGPALAAGRIVATDPSFVVEGRGRWTADATDPSGSRSRLVATLTSSDIEASMLRLGYQPGIEGEEMRIDLDLQWSGGPNGRFLESLDGQVQVHLGSGQLNDVEPGAGRMFGLLSITALPRRLSLDFRDVFQKGFGFDEINGNFRLDDGTAYTCDLSLVGPAADIGITGQADLVAGNYSQAAVVNANLGSTLPVVGAIAAGPQVAAALFLFSQIFKQPLKEVGQVYYSMSGSWENPVVESTDAEAFAAHAARAGCLTTAGND